jgi:hypothetical protein
MQHKIAACHDYFAECMSELRSLAALKSFAFSPAVF